MGFLFFLKFNKPILLKLESNVTSWFVETVTGQLGEAVARCLHSWLAHLYQALGARANHSSHQEGAPPPRPAPSYGGTHTQAPSGGWGVGPQRGGAATHCWAVVPAPSDTPAGALATPRAPGALREPPAAHTTAAAAALHS